MRDRRKVINHAFYITLLDIQVEGEFHSAGYVFMVQLQNRKLRIYFTLDICGRFNSTLGST